MDQQRLTAVVGDGDRLAPHVFQHEHRRGIGGQTSRLPVAYTRH